MRRFGKILVGVDLHQGDRFAASNLSAASRQAIQTGLWLAGATQGELTYFSALELSPQGEHAVEIDREQMIRTVEDAAREVLAGLVTEAQAAGVAAQSKLSIGKGWYELTREVIRGAYDLLIAGTRHQGDASRLLFGSTATKLIRKCPCPVWITKPGEFHDPMNLLVASDLTDVGEQALHLAVSLGQLFGARIHLLHAVESHFEQMMKMTGLPEEECRRYRDREYERAETALNEQLSRTDYRTVTPGVRTFVIEGPAEEAILQAVREHEIDLVILGTSGRGGLPGMLLGNTAERLLPELPCSLLALKPLGFVSPVTA